MIKKMLFVSALVIIITLFQIGPYLQFGEQNQTEYTWVDNSIYLSIIHHSTDIVNANPFTPYNERYLTIIPFIIVNKIAEFIPIERAYMLWNVMLTTLVIVLSMLFFEKLGINPYFGSILFIFINSGLYPLESIEWWNGHFFLGNIWHPLYLYEIALILVGILILISNIKHAEKIYGLLSFLLYFSRPYEIIIIYPFMLFAYYVEKKKINWWVIGSGILIGIHYLWSKTFAGYIDQTNVYNTAFHLDAFWIVFSFGWMIYWAINVWKETGPQIGKTLFCGAIIALTGIHFFPLNIRLVHLLTLFAGLAGTIGFFLEENKLLKIIYLIMLLGSVYGGYQSSIELYERNFMKYTENDVKLGNYSRENQLTGSILTPAYY